MFWRQDASHVPDLRPDRKQTVGRPGKSCFFIKTGETSTMIGHLTYGVAWGMMRPCDPETAYPLTDHVRDGKSSRTGKTQTVDQHRTPELNMHYIYFYDSTSFS